MAPPIENTSDTHPLNSAIVGFASRVSRYFLDFLETDFKKQRAPRRKIQLKNDAGFRTGLPLRKYRSLHDMVWKLLSSPVGELGPLQIPRARYTAPISPTLRDLIRQQVDSLKSETFQNVRKETLEFAQRKRGAAVKNPERYIEDVQVTFTECVGKHVVTQILALLDGPFRQQAYSAVESVYEIETDLVDSLAAQVLDKIPTALNKFVVSSDLSETESVLDEFFSETEVKERIKLFFDDFATADAYQELRDLTNYMRLGGENLQLYLYVCELRFGTTVFPLFYIPITAAMDEKSGAFVVTFDPHLYIHKRAIDYIVQELDSSAMKLALSPIDKRIIYLEPERSFLDEMERILTRMTPTFDLSGHFDVRQPNIETAASTNLRLSKTAHFAVFDKSDESLLNDYEALLAALNADQKAVVDLFQSIISGFLLNDPHSVREKVSDQWDRMSPPDRLVAVSPIPLNEEQRKILTALDDPACRFITVQGPPGTGKSHTITAIAFNCILHGKNALILSDKQEALDVVEDKLKSALSSVRQDDDFPDPILRLGKTGNTYTRLISQSSQEKIRNHYRATKTYEEELSDEIKETNENIRKSLTQTIDAYATVSLKEIEELHQLENQIDLRINGFSALLQNKIGPAAQGRLQTALAESEQAVSAAEFFNRKFAGGSFQALLDVVRAYSTAAKLETLRKDVTALRLFRVLGPRQVPLLYQFIVEYEKLKWPMFGFLFTGAKARAVNVRVGEALPCTNALDLHKRLSNLRTVYDSLVIVKQALMEDGLSDEVGEFVYQIITTDRESCPTAPAVLKLLEAFAGTTRTSSDLLTPLAIGDKYFATVAELLDFLSKATRYALLWHKVDRALSSAPSFDYVESKTRLEQLYTTRMTHEIDRRFVEYVEKNRATAKTLGGVIKAKQQFPQDAFEDLKQAFPCIIAGIREFAEYVPLRQEIFDVVVIDEASQVSVAQAFPALLRARKVVVLGDQKQFSNVKSANASIALNQGYLTDLDQYFRSNISDAADKIQRLKQFNVKNSVLEFFDLIANYTDMLRKHFRGYQELISFSSKYFYSGQLQAIKIRGKPVEDIIQFSFVEQATKPERFKNINTPEADFILQCLKTMIDDGEELSVGIITPFREQQQYLTKRIFADTYAEKFEDLQLKIMTFDTCQGEERDVIFYSMVATEQHDVLNYVFPVTIEDIDQHVEEALKAQRLNVGFSRAKEKIHFVLSKPIEKYRGSIARVLAHYKTLLDDRTVPEAEDTDPNSPMEGKILDWITKTAFYQKNEDRLELFAQFPIGEYLRQLHPTYQHPAYRCDFLLCYQSENRMINVIIEYDGFKEHFTNHKTIHAGNYSDSYRPDDIERQMVLESYGYKFLRINRFNLGFDPVTTLSERLYALIQAATNHRDATVVGQIRDGASQLEDGTARHCRKCETVKPNEEFFDPKLQNGKGGYGQICLACKMANGSSTFKAGPRKRIRRYWRRQ